MARAVLDPDDEKALAATRMTFGEHLDELRRRLIKAILASLAGLAVVFWQNEAVMEIVTRPYRQVMDDLHQDTSLNAFSIAEPFFASVKVSFIVGLILTAPYWIYQIWAFIGAGLYRHERKMVTKYVPFCVVLFVTGVVFGYLFLIPMGIRYLLTFADPMLVQNTIGLRQYLGLFTVLTLVLGVAFQLPIVMIGLARAGMMTPESFRKKRKWMILIIFIVSAILTPPDPVTQCLMAFPLVGLYELGIYLSWMGMGRSRPPIRWKDAWSRLRIPLVIVLLLFVFREPLIKAWKQRQAEGRLYGEQLDQPDVPAIAAVFLDRPVASAYRVDEDGPKARVAVDAEGGFFLIEVRNDRRSTVPLTRRRNTKDGPSMTAAFWRSGTAVVEVTLPPSVPYRDFVPELLRALDVGPESVRDAVGPMLRSITGMGKGLEPGAALAAFQEWYDAHEEGRLEQHLVEER